MIMEHEQKVVMLFESAFKINSQYHYSQSFFNYNS